MAKAKAGRVGSDITLSAWSSPGRSGYSRGRAAREVGARLQDPRHLRGHPADPAADRGPPRARPDQRRAQVATTYDDPEPRTDRGSRARRTSGRCSRCRLAGLAQGLGLGGRPPWRWPGRPAARCRAAGGRSRRCPGSWRRRLRGSDGRDRLGSGACRELGRAQRRLVVAPFLGAAFLAGDFFAGSSSSRADFLAGACRLAGRLLGRRLRWRPLFAGAFFATFLATSAGVASTSGRPSSPLLGGALASVPLPVPSAVLGRRLCGRGEWPAWRARRPGPSATPRRAGDAAVRAAAPRRRVRPAPAGSLRACPASRASAGCRGRLTTPAGHRRRHHRDGSPTGP